MDAGAACTVRRRTSRTLAAFCAAALTVCLSVPAFAQGADSEFASPLSSTSTTTTTTAVVVGGIVLTVVLTTPEPDRKSALEDYMRHNAVALQQDITLGAGDTVDDLAVAFQIPDEDRNSFARLLRHHRKKLLPLTDPESLDASRVRSFVGIIHRAMLEEPALREHAVALQDAAKDTTSSDGSSAS
jgi:hypothetical protein